MPKSQPFTELPAWVVERRQSRPEPSKQQPRPARVATGKPGPAAQFNASTKISELLFRAGWALVTGDGDSPGSTWKHPKATSAKSASIGEDSRLYVYSPNTPLPECNGPESNGWDAFDVYRHLDYGGDASAAAAELIRTGAVAASPAGTATARRLELEQFWAETPALAYVHLLAQARRVGPWALLARVLLQLLCTVPPWVRGDSGIGSPMALNMFVAMVGASGRGKGLTDSVAGEYVEVFYGGQLSEVFDRPVGSGEGIAGEFLRDDGDEEDADDRQFRPVIFTALEVDTVAALFARTGTTLSAELRKMFMGEALGQTNATKATNRLVPAHRYRGGLVIGVQPDQSAAILNGATGGLPQRFAWVFVDDPTAPAEAPPTPTKLRIDVPQIRRAFLNVPDTAKRAMDAHRLGGLHGAPIDPLDAHRLVVHYRVAAGLALLELATLEGRTRDQVEVTEDDWRRADVVMQMSDLARQTCLDALADQKRRTKVARAHDAADHDEIKAERALQTVKAAMVRALQTADKPLSRKLLRAVLRSDQRALLDPAIQALTAEERLSVIETPSPASPTGVATTYRLATADRSTQ